MDDLMKHIHDLVHVAVNTLIWLIFIVSLRYFTTQLISEGTFNEPMFEQLLSSRPSGWVCIQTKLNKLLQFLTKIIPDIF